MPLVAQYKAWACSSHCCTNRFVAKPRFSKCSSTISLRKFSSRQETQKTIKPRGFWAHITNQRKCFDELGQRLGIQHLDDWYGTLSQKVFEENDAKQLLRVHSGSPTNAIMQAYPEHNWMPWKFKMAPQGFWKSLENQRRYFDWLGKELGVVNLNDWYHKLSQKALTENGARRLLLIYNGSPSAALKAAYPDHNWILWKFDTAPQGFWKDAVNQRQFFDDLGSKLGIDSFDDWYSNLSVQIIVDHGGHGLLDQYRDSPIAALMAAYPEHHWIPWKFNFVPQGFWKSPENIKHYLDYVSEKLSIQTLDDWYRVDWAQLQQFGGHQLLARHKGFYQVLKDHYPHHPWDPRKFQHGGRKTQRWLVVTLKKMFPNAEILEDYMHPKAVSSSNRPLQLDVFIPSMSLAFEYQGKQHYEEIELFGPARIYQQRDEEKRALCITNNIKLIEVPYWWNRSQESLQNIIQGNPVNPL